MDDEVVGTKCPATSFLNYSNLSEVRNCVKCAELEVQLQQVLNELNSVQLITEMLNKGKFKRIMLQCRYNRWTPNGK